MENVQPQKLQNSRLQYVQKKSRISTYKLIWLHQSKILSSEKMIKKVLESNIPICCSPANRKSNAAWNNK
jgi:hypothetical protein